jgi:hypothetical protein
MKKIALIIIAGLLLVSCGKKEVKQPSQESKIAQEAFALAETLRTGFTKRDMNTLRNNSTEAGFRDLTMNTRPYDSVDLTFTPRWMEIDGSQVALNISWKSSWSEKGRSSDDRGMAVFVMEGKPLKLASILRANPFVLPE